MAKYLDPKADLTFKKIFGEHPELVISLLNALLPFSEEQKIKSRLFDTTQFYALQGATYRKQISCR